MKTTAFQLAIGLLASPLVAAHPAPQRDELVARVELAPDMVDHAIKPSPRPTRHHADGPVLLPNGTIVAENGNGGFIVLDLHYTKHAHPEHVAKPTPHPLKAEKHASMTTHAAGTHASGAAAAALTEKRSTNSSSSPLTLGYGIAYSPYFASGACKSAPQVAQDLAKLTDYDIIRLYGVDCDSVSSVLAALHPGQRLFAGISDISEVTTQTQSLIAQVEGSWAKVHTVSIGNELINSGSASVGAVTSAIGTARGILRVASFTGPIVTVDTMVATVNHPALCAASDYCAINCHAFFDSSAIPQGAGAFVRGWVEKVQAIAGGKPVVVTESGWPSRGEANGLAVPSLENQMLAVKSLAQAFPEGDLILYNSFNDHWLKDDQYTFGAQQWWGLYGDAPSGA